MLLLKREINPKVVLMIMLLGTFVASVSQSMLTSALPSVMHEFEIDATLGQLLTTSYIYTLGIVGAFSAFLIVRCNVRHLFLGMLALFAAGCVLAFFSVNYPLLLVGRLMQACATGVLMPLLQVIALAIYPKSQHGQALGLVGMVQGFAPVLGPTLSGVITDALGWRPIFAILGTCAFISLVGCSLVVRDVGEHERISVDAPSLVMYTLGLIMFMAGVTGWEQFGFFHGASTMSVLVAVMLIAIFSARQLGLDNPYLNLRLFSHKSFSQGMVLLCIAQFVMAASALQVPLYMQEIHGYSATKSGLVLLVGAICMPLLNPVTGRIYDRWGAKVNAIVGFFLLIVGTGSFVFFNDHTPAFMIVLMYALRMTGVSFVLMPMTAYCMSELEKKDTPQGTAMVNSFRQIIGSLGSSIMVAIVTIFSAGGGGTAGVTMHGFSVSFGIQALVAAFAFVAVSVVSALIGWRKHRKKVAAKHAYPESLGEEETTSSDKEGMPRA